jgi:rSAM/selenodomain-associated transferase 2
VNISIVIPTLNEEGCLPGLLDKLAPLRRRGAEVIVVDGGSADDTVATAERAGVEIFHTPPGRALQMNAGARAARGDVLLFLHADTIPPPWADQLIVAALARGPHVWGRFDVIITGRARMLRVVAWLMNLRSRISGIATGDQGIFVAREVFHAVHGFPLQALMEDIEISRKLRRHSRPICLREAVTTSGRRWDRNGVWRTILLMSRIRLAYWRGTPADELAKVYR